jgi:hypothetical protein
MGWGIWYGIMYIPALHVGPGGFWAWSVSGVKHGIGWPTVDLVLKEFLRGPGTIERRSRNAIP